MPRIVAPPIVEPEQIRDEREALISELVARASAGKMQAWARLYQEFFDSIFRHVRYLAGNTPLVEDLVQEVFARGLAGLPDFDGRSAFSTWLHGIAVNVVRNHWRAERSTARAHDRLRAVTTVRGDNRQNDVDRAHVSELRARVLYAVLDELPEHLRAAFVLRDLEGFAPAEAAAQLGISPGNLSVRATRARQRIRQELEKLGWLNPSGEEGST